MPTSQIYLELRTGQLPGIERGYPDYPRSTFFSTLKRVRRRLREGIKVHEPGDTAFIERLTDDAFLAGQRVKEREQSAPESPLQTTQSPVPAPVEVSPPAPNVEAQKAALVRRLEQLAAEAVPESKFRANAEAKPYRPHQDRYGSDPF